MSHTYDSALLAPQRTLIANAMITMLRPLTIPGLGLGGAADGFLEAVISTATGIDSKQDEDEIDLLWSELGARSPAVAICPRDLKVDPTGGPGQGQGELSIDVYFVTGHERGVTEGRAEGDAIAAASDAADPGMWALLELVWARLYDQKPVGLGTWARELKLVREFEVITAENFTLWKQEWRMKITRNANMYRGLLQKVTDFKTTLEPVGDEPAAKHMKLDSDV